MLYLENVNLFNHSARTLQTNTQLGLLCQYRAMHYSTSRGKNQQSAVRTARECAYVSLWTTVVHNTAQYSSDTFPSYLL